MYLSKRLQAIFIELNFKDEQLHQFEKNSDEYLEKSSIRMNRKN